MHGLQKKCDFSSNAFPSNVEARDMAILRTDLTFSPEERERNVKKLPRQRCDLIKSKRVAWGIRASWSGQSGKKLVVSHGEKRMRVQIGQEEQRGPMICICNI
jgi:hypothetical protein